MTEDESRFVSQIHVAQADGSGGVQYTFNDQSSTDLRWSHDGQWIAFISVHGGAHRAVNGLVLLCGWAETPLPSGSTPERRPSGRSIADVLRDAVSTSLR